MNGLYRPAFERDGCGFGLMAHMDGIASHDLVHTAILSLSRLTHRGAVAADGKTGDGCGLLLQKPDRFFRAVTADLSIRLAPRYAVGMVFLSPHGGLGPRARQRLEREVTGQGLTVAGWREVPVEPRACGAEALKTLPQVSQIFVNAPRAMDADAFERHLYIARRRCEKALETSDGLFYVVSLSARVIGYKGLVMPLNLPVFYPELNDPRVESSICVFHQRFSTNTSPQWRLAQPFRLLAHNGEINTLQGNRNWSRARSQKLLTPLIPHLQDVRPWVSEQGSDSCCLDNMLEALHMGGMDILRAMRLLIPPAWQNVAGMDADLRAFYEYNSMHMEPWDGPAGIVLTDGRVAACVMDRNGLRPARYVITKDRQLTLASEVGVYDYPPEQVVRKGRLSPGEMLAVDTEGGELLVSGAIDRRLKRRQPYRAWLARHAVYLESRLDEEQACKVRVTPHRLRRYQKMFGVSLEEQEQVLRVLAEAGQEALGSMGDDTPLAVFSHRPRSLFDYFRQQFAQVTNPPIDPLRERLVMSLETCFGPEQNLFQEDAGHARRVVVHSPVLSASKFRELLHGSRTGFSHQLIDLAYPPALGLRRALERIGDRAVQAVRQGHTLLVLSDRRLSRHALPVHALLATGAVHHRLIDEGLRCDANILVQTGCARDSHHFAVLIGYGATAVYPYLAYDCLCGMQQAGVLGERDGLELMRNYRRGINRGLYKILSKMGISTVASYRGAQLFEAVGLHQEVVELCFAGTSSRIQGAGFDELEQAQRQWWMAAWDERRPVDAGGLLKYVQHGEYHACNPDVVQALHEAVATGDYGQYQRYAKRVNQRPAMAIRDLLGLREDVSSVALEDVEPVEEILTRFETGAMSLGALSPEAHETLALAMNRLGARSNCGEGGEDPARFGTAKCSRVKQVASGRFGVTPHYLVNGDVLQIKMAQGAKPGEGGQLAGRKVDALIARLRYTTPGTPLISPPPHHDIYSIEDLAQLIFDLKQVNPQALVSVKLVSEPGVGTIAVGVAKAYADQITISGHDGGTGASPLSSVHYAGSPWELGLAETHQVLCANNLRDKVRLQTDGGLKTGLDVVKAAILGAESFGFGTVALVAMGCKYLRICHLNNCATGVATQHPLLRAQHFRGEAEKVMWFFHCVARETREWMARLGVTELDRLRGRTDLLRRLPGQTSAQGGLDLSNLLTNTDAVAEGRPVRRQPRNRPADRGVLAERMVTECLSAIAKRAGGLFHYRLRNDNRAIGARLSGEIARRWGNKGMEDAPLVLRLQGTAGQSFGVWNAGGLHLYLDGDANDYVGKGMAGGRIVIRPPGWSGLRTQDNVIIGNTCLYGATGGRLYAAGLAGERFAVRNSGAIAVVEGVGEHGCEYMTGGVVVVLGGTGINFGAGMTGGFAFVLDADNVFADRLNHEMVDIHRIDTEDTDAHRRFLRALLTDYVAETASPWGRQILDDFSGMSSSFWLVKPILSDLAGLLNGLEQAA